MLVLNTRRSYIKAFLRSAAVPHHCLSPVSTRGLRSGCSQDVDVFQQVRKSSVFCIYLTAICCEVSLKNSTRPRWQDFSPLGQRTGHPDDGTWVSEPLTEDDASPIDNTNTYYRNQYDCSLACAAYANTHSWITYFSVHRIERCEKIMLLELCFNRT